MVRRRLWWWVVAAVKGVCFVFWRQLWLCFEKTVFIKSTLENWWRSAEFLYKLFFFYFERWPFLFRIYISLGLICLVCYCVDHGIGFMLNFINLVLLLAQNWGTKLDDEVRMQVFLSNIGVRCFFFTNLAFWIFFHFWSL